MTGGNSVQRSSSQFHTGKSHFQIPLPRGTTTEDPMKRFATSIKAALALCALVMFLNPQPARADEALPGPIEPAARCGDGTVNQASEQCDHGTSGSATCTPQCTTITPTPIRSIDVEQGHIKVLDVDELRLKKPLDATYTLKMPELMPRHSYGFAFMGRYLVGVESPTPNALQLDAAVMWRDIPTHCGFRLGVSPGAFWFPGDMNGDSKAGFAISTAAGFLVGWEYGGLYFGPQATYLGSGYRDQIMVDLGLHGYALFNGDKDMHTGIIDFGLGVPVLRPHNREDQRDSFRTVMFTIGLGWFVRPQPKGAEEPESAKSEPVCGNGITENGEECDHGSGGSPACTNKCKKITVQQPKCGDGIVNQASEQCDHGPNGSPACTPQCKNIQ